MASCTLASRPNVVSCTYAGSPLLRASRKSVASKAGVLAEMVPLSGLITTWPTLENCVPVCVMMTFLPSGILLDLHIFLVRMAVDDYVDAAATLRQRRAAPDVGRPRPGQGVPAAQRNRRPPRVPDSRRFALLRQAPRRCRPRKSRTRTYGRHRFARTISATTPSALPAW